MYRKLYQISRAKQSIAANPHWEADSIGKWMTNRHMTRTYKPQGIFPRLIIWTHQFSSLSSNAFIVSPNTTITPLNGTHIKPLHDTPLSNVLSFFVIFLSLRIYKHIRSYIYSLILSTPQDPFHFVFMCFFTWIYGFPCRKNPEFIYFHITQKKLENLVIFHVTGCEKYWKISLVILAYNWVNLI